MTHFLLVDVDQDVLIDQSCNEWNKSSKYILSSSRDPDLGPEALGTQLRFQAPFDANGMLYHIGTAGGTCNYRNPHSAGAVVASM